MSENICLMIPLLIGLPRAPVTTSNPCPFFKLMNFAYWSLILQLLTTPSISWMAPPSVVTLGFFLHVENSSSLHDHVARNVQLQCRALSHRAVSRDWLESRLGIPITCSRIPSSASSPTHRTVSMWAEKQSLAFLHLFAEAICILLRRYAGLCENIDHLSPLEARAGTDLGNKYV